MPNNNQQTKIVVDSPIQKIDLNKNPLNNIYNKKEKPLKDMRAPRPKFYQQHWFKILLGFLGVLVIVISIVGVIAFQTYKKGLVVKSQALAARDIALKAYTSFKSQNLPQTKTDLEELKKQVSVVETSLQDLKILASVPKVKNYYHDSFYAINAGKYAIDGSIKAVDTLAPYADVLGFTAEDKEETGTAEDRIKMMIEALDKIMPDFDAILDNFNKATAELDKINPNNYPEEVYGLKVKQQIIDIQKQSKNTVERIAEFKPVLAQLPTIAGGKKQRKKYLILFQNDNELRPTGGFLTAYATIWIEDGKVTPEKSDDIYELDKKFIKTEAIPKQLGKYLTTESRWNLRDMNIYPDYKQSMDKFLTSYLKIKGEPRDIDGIIAIDTHVLTGLLKVIGAVEVPGYGPFSADNDPTCDCPQVVHALSEIITRPVGYVKVDRKGVLGPLMSSILSKTYQAPRQYFTALFDLLWTSIENRNIQMYFMDKDAQAAAETVNAAGRMIAPEGKDFLAVVNANLGGAKSNLYITYDVKQEVSAPSNGMIKKKVTITYKNNHPADNCDLEAGLLCLNSTLRDWTRLYVPKGSKFISSDGFNDTMTSYDEENFTVFEQFFILEPNGAKKLIVEYEVPYNDNTNYQAYVWKQGGVDPFPVVFDVNGGQEEVLVNKDTTFETKF